MPEQSGADSQAASDTVAKGGSLADYLRANKIRNAVPADAPATGADAEATRSPQAPRPNEPHRIASPPRRPLPTYDELTAPPAEAPEIVKRAPEMFAKPSRLGESPANEPTGSDIGRAMPQPVEAPSAPATAESIASLPAPTPTNMPSQAASDQGDRLADVPDDGNQVIPLSDPVAEPLPAESFAANGGSPQLNQESEESEFSVLSIPSVDGSEQMTPPVPMLPPTPSITLHTTRLLEMAQHSLVKSEQSLLRGATHTARKHAIEAIQAVVAMRDAQEGGNLHGQQLDQAFDAIRESKDFCGEFGVIDANALQRMVMVHETTALKERDLSTVSALEATETYLEFAKEQLALATGGVREGSQALLLLGQAEFQIASKTDAHATSVAVAVQRAAVEAEPYYAVGYRVLGSTMLNLGLVEEASDCLVTSVKLEPTRLAYQRLLEIARRTGDADMAKSCKKSLEDPRMSEGNLVRSLPPDQFAATYRPAPGAIRKAQQASPKVETAKKKEESAVRVGFRSLFSFGRK